MTPSKFLALGLASVASAQGARWSDSFSVRGLMSTTVQGAGTDQVVFDDGTGAALYVCGTFTAAGDADVDAIAKWDGARWSSFGGPVSLPNPSSGPSVEQLAVFDDGSGPALYAGGRFDTIGGVSANAIAKWNGSTWEPLGPNAVAGNDLIITGLEALDDGSGEALYVGLTTSTIGGLPATSLAKWDGANWSLVGTPISGGVYDFEMYDSGAGPQLYVAGQLLQWGTSQFSSVITWDGANWSTVGTAIYNSAHVLEVYDDGAGGELYLGGTFDTIGGTLVAHGIAKWNGSAWSALGSGVFKQVAGDGVYSLEVYDDGAGPALFVGGGFSQAGGLLTPNIARWKAGAWSTVGTPPGVHAGGSGSSLSGPLVVRTLATFDSGGGPELVLAGSFLSAGAMPAYSIVRWNGSTWSTLGGGQALDRSPLAFANFGGQLYAAGLFGMAGDFLTPNLMTWNGSSWSPGPGRIGGITYSLFEHDDGNGDALFVGGDFGFVQDQTVHTIESLARFDGSQWNELGTGLPDATHGVRVMAEYDDGSGTALFVGGEFTSVGGVAARRIARWDGSTWSMLGPNSLSNDALALVVYDDGQGGGSQLYVGGEFLKAAGENVFAIARWNGSSWSGVGNGFSTRVNALAVFDDGSGPALYAGGAFTAAPPYVVDHIARWNGVEWLPVGAGFNDEVEALAVFDDGSGPALYAGGRFTASGSTPTAHFARWDGQSWSEVDGGVDATVHTLAVVDDGVGFGPALFVGGDFATAGDVVSVRVARWGSWCDIATYCTSGVTSSGCVPAISGTGTPSASATSGFTISVANVEGQKQGHVFYGVNGSIAAPWGASSHFLCVKAPTQRTGTQDSGGTAGACDGAISLDWNAYVATHPTSLGAPFSAGQSVWAQLYFRDPPGPKTTALSNGLAFTICP